MHARRFGSLISCSCASTSTASPCSHATRHYATLPPAKERTPSKALDFTAPLFERKSGTAPWFNPSASGWERWIKQSRTVEPIVEPIAKVVLPRSIKGRNDDGRDRYKLPLLKSYLALRSSSHSLLRMLPPSTIRRLLDETKEYNLPLVNRILSEDLRNLKVKSKERQEAKDRDNDLVEANLAEYSEREVVNQLERSNEMANAREMGEEVKGEVVDKRAKWMEEDYGNDTWSGIVDSLDQQQAREHLQSIVTAPTLDYLPPVVVDSFPELSDLDRLDKIWSQFSFSPTTTPDALPPPLSDDDYRISLSLLLKIVTPSYTHSQSALPLALKIFRRLISTRSIPQEAIADTPDELGTNGEALSSEVIFRLVILRSVVGAATDAKEYAIAIDALRVLASLREAHLEIGELTTDVDFSLLRAQIEDAMIDAQELSRNHYLLRAPLTPTDPLLIAYSLLYEILPSFSHPPLTRPSSSLIVGLLAEFTTEAAKRERYDLIGPLWEKMGEFDGHSWIAFPVRTKLLRWFGGVAPFRTYATEYEEDRPIRGTNSTAFFDFAVGTYAIVSQRRFVAPVPMADRYVFLRTLCEARVGSGRMGDLAIRFYQLFKSTSSADNPFILAPATLLTMVRSCTLEGGGTNNLEFARKLIADHVALLTSPSSPYSTPSRRILPQDISTLAQCYSIVGDHESTGQVYRYLLEQKMIPDLKDLLIIFGTAARWNPGLARTNLRLAFDTGIIITFEMVRIVLLNSIAFHRTNRSASTNEISVLLSLARSFGLTNEEVFDLSQIAFSLTLGGKKGSSHAEWNIPDSQLWGMILQRTDKGEMRPSVLNSLIRKADREDAWRSVMTLFRRGVNAGIIDERIVHSALSSLLNSYRTNRSDSSKRLSLHAFFREIIDYAFSFSPSPPYPSSLSPSSSSLSTLQSNRPTISIMRKDTFEIVLKCCLKLGDLGAVEVVRRRMEEAGFVVREEFVRGFRSAEILQRREKGERERE